MIVIIGLSLHLSPVWFSRLYLDMSIDIPEDKAREALTDVLSHINCTIKELRRLFLIEDLVDSLKVFIYLSLYIRSYTGFWQVTQPNHIPCQKPIQHLCYPSKRHLFGPQLKFQILCDMFSLLSCYCN